MQAVSSAAAGDKNVPCNDRVQFSRDGGWSPMKAIWRGQVIAESDRTLEVRGYRYFPRETVRMDLLRLAPKTTSDLDCPHGVQFYDLAADAARSDEADRSLDRFLERRRDRVSVDAPQQTQDTSSSTTLLTRVTRIFQKSVFTEATPAARTGHPAGRFAARAHAASVPGVFSRVERRRRRDDIRVRQRIRHGTIAMQASVAETAGHCFRPVIYNENTYHSVWRRKRPPRSRRFHAGRCDRPMIHLGNTASRSFAPCNLLSRSITASVAAINFETTPLRPAIGLRS